jgi:hypothetical protein
MAQQIVANDTPAHNSWCLDTRRPKRDATCGAKKEGKTVKQSVVLSFLATLLWHISPYQAGTDGVALAASNAPETPSRTAVVLNVSELDDLIARMVREKHLVGLSVGVMQEGKVVLAKGYGVRSLDDQRPCHS